jgi:Holliday junction resolvasome RuvABC endonuclease subunit
MNGISIGIDPGASGGIACLYERQHEVFKLDCTERDVEEFMREQCLDGAFAYIERVHSMPKQGVASSFKFGQSYGFLRGLLIGLRIPFEEVTPQKWQKAMGCLSKGDKNVTKARAQSLFPQIKVHHHNADSLLIAEFCRRKNL